MPKIGERVATGVYYQGEGSYSIKVSTGKRKKNGAYNIHTETFRGTEREAIVRRAKLITEIAEGRLRPPERRKLTAGEYFEKYFAYNAERAKLGKITESTADFYKQTIRRYFGVIWKVGLARVTAKQILDVLISLKEAGRSTDYILSVFRAFRAAWLASKRLHVQVPDILDDVTAMLPQATKKHRIVLQPAQSKALLAAAKDHPVTHAILVCLLTTAMRLNECLGLRWADVDLERMIVTVEQQVIRAGSEPKFGPHKTFKTHGPRHIRMTRILAEELRRLKPILAAMKLRAGEDWRDFDLCFPTSIGTPYAYGRWEQDHFIPLFDKAGIPRIRAHDLRHSVATFLIAQGVPVPVVQEICGHAEIKTTMGYTHLIVETQNEAMEKIDRALE